MRPTTAMMEDADLDTDEEEEEEEEAEEEEEEEEEDVNPSSRHSVRVTLEAMSSTALLPVQPSPFAPSSPTPTGKRRRRPETVVHASSTSAVSAVSAASAASAANTGECECECECECACECALRTAPRQWSICGTGSFINKSATFAGRRLVDSAHSSHAFCEWTAPVRLPTTSGSLPTNLRHERGSGRCTPLY